MKRYQIMRLDKDFIFLHNDPILRGSRRKMIAISNSKELAMFKYEREDYECSEACSEKIAYEVAKILGYKCAKIDLAMDNENKLGVLNYYFSNFNSSFHTDIIYYLNVSVDRRNEYYTISNIKKTLDSLKLDLFKEFVKIMVFDALIGEQDRHEENWGITEKNKTIFLSPLYDNGDSLLREFKNSEILKKYSDGTKDFDLYIYRSKTLIYKENNKEKYKHFELIEYLYGKFPKLIVPEIKNLCKLTDENIQDILDKIPDELLTAQHKKFIMQYLIKRRNILMNIIKKGEE